MRSWLPLTAFGPFQLEARPDALAEPALSELHASLTTARMVLSAVTLTGPSEPFALRLTDGGTGSMTMPPPPPPPVHCDPAIIATPAIAATHPHSARIWNDM